MNLHRTLGPTAALAATTLVAALPATAAAEPSPFGLWVRGDGKAKVRIDRCGADLCAVNTWIREGVRDERVGDRLVMSVRDGGGGRWAGTAFDPQRDMSYRLSMTVRETTMTSRGCIVAGLLCTDMGWTRLSEGAEQKRGWTP